MHTVWFCEKRQLVNKAVFACTKILKNTFLYSPKISSYWYVKTIIATLERKYSLKNEGKQKPVLSARFLLCARLTLPPMTTLPPVSCPA